MGGKAEIPSKTFSLESLPGMLVSDLQPFAGGSESIQIFYWQQYIENSEISTAHLQAMH
jgi:hypothetical protein